MATRPRNLNIHHDGVLAIAVGRSRKDTAWKNRETTWSELLGRLSVTTRTRETEAEYARLPKPQRDEIKDVGGFVGGALKGGRRRADTVQWRQVVTLDVDFAQDDLWFAVETAWDFACAMYSTHSHTTALQRLRLVLPLLRPVTPEEYVPLARKLADSININFFDDTTYEPHRLMYWPSSPADGEYIFEHQDLPWLDPDKILAQYPDWRDHSHWPESDRQRAALRKEATRQGDPTTKPGIVGAFCRAYSIPEVIEAHLAEIYVSCGEGRYTYAAGSTAAGLVLYDGDSFAFSHHSTDPCSGRLVNAFDMVRIHLFGAEDENADQGVPVTKLPSWTKMLEFCQGDERVVRQLAIDRLTQAGADFDDSEDQAWLNQLIMDKSGRIESSAANVILILNNDPHLRGRMVLDELAHRELVVDDLPWREVEGARAYWTDTDDAGLRNYLSKCYGIKGKEVISDALREVMLSRAFHPVKDYLAGLAWDGISRIETLLVDYLGAEDSKYTRAVTLSTLKAAVARVMDPGCKFDYMLTLVGAQGLGKSELVARLGGSWYSDSIYTVTGKEAFEVLQGNWIVEMAELTATKKSEVEAVKHFISKKEDCFRVSYDRRVSWFPRQCVFIGTTNNEVFLRDQTGNRRFWPVPVGVQRATHSLWADFDQYEIDQVWAEARDTWLENPNLYIGAELEKEAILMQRGHTEESEKAGLVREYLDLLLPENWEDMNLYERRGFIHNRDFGSRQEGTVVRDRVCVMEIWAELFSGDPKNINSLLSREINDILISTEGWKRHRHPLSFGKNYGRQRGFIRQQS